MNEYPNGEKYGQTAHETIVNINSNFNRSDPVGLIYFIEMLNIKPLFNMN
jgi:hypothetical protein